MDNNQLDYNNNDFEYKENKGKNKQNGCLWIFLIFIASVLIIFTFVILFKLFRADDYMDNYTYNLEQTSDFENNDVLELIDTLEVEENYTFDFNDLNSTLTENPFPNPLPVGTNYTFDASTQSEKNVKENNTISLEVGVDIEPGVYTIKKEGTVAMTAETVIANNFEYIEDVNYYNVPLVAGDTIYIDYWDSDSKETGKVNLTAQSEYVNFEPNLNGVFVYGLNQFDSQVQFTADSYGSIIYGFNFPGENEGYQNEYLFDVDLTLPGSPGSYFAVQYNKPA